MARYEILLTRSARKELERLPPRLASNVLRRIEALGENPRPPGCIKLTGAEDLWRIRIGDYRVLFDIQDDKLLIDILAIRHRSDAYR